MGIRAKSICRYINCNKLINKPGYCDEHKKDNNNFSKLKKDERSTIFYRSNKWREASIRHRVIEPLCRECKEKGIIKSGEMVHHDPDLIYLLDNNLNPCNDKYLITLCNNCHLGHLRNKKK